MKYEDLKDKFKFKNQEGKSFLTYIAEKKSKHVWDISDDRVSEGDISSDWDCDDILRLINEGSWVIQDEKQVEVAPELQEQAAEVKTLRDEFALCVLSSVYTAAIKADSDLFTYEDWRYGLALDAYKMADAMLEVRKK